MLLRNSSIVPISDMTGIMEFAGIWKKHSQVFGTPAYYTFKLYAEADVEKTVSAKTSAGSYSVAQGVNRLPEIADVPYLDVVAALNKDGSKLTLFCVNRSVDTDITATILLHGFAAGNSAAVQTLSSASLTDVNDDVSPVHVRPVASSETVQTSDWKHTFPHASITVIAFDRAAAR
jgi:alpha-N-arabinofuranosidase